MGVAVVSTSFREADILNLWISHLLAEDIDLILIADKLADDQSRDILENWRRGTNGMVQWFDDTEDSHRQAWWTDRLAETAHEQGMEWILPADVDEFPYSLTGESLGKTLENVSVDKLFLQVWPHLDWQHRYEQAHRLPKVCYRYNPNAQVVMGSHDVNLPGGERDILAMRELQYRSFSHFCQKIDDRNATLEPQARARQDGYHHLRLENASVEERQHEWDLITSQPSIVDPIPTRMAKDMLPV